MTGRTSSAGIPTRRLLFILTGVAVVILGGIYYMVDPATSRFMPKCILHTLTGLDCPGCGAQRMFHALLHGDFAAAWEANPFLLCCLPLLVMGIWADLRPGLFRRITYSQWFIWGFAGAVILWGILRNIHNT